MYKLLVPVLVIGGLLACDTSGSKGDDDVTDAGDDDATTDLSGLNDLTFGDDDDDDDDDEFAGDPGDCTVTVPSNAKVITSSGVSNTAGDVAVVCAGANYVSNSGSGVFFALPGSDVALNSNNSWVWAQGDASIAINSDRSEITLEPTVTTSGFGQDTVTYECATVTIDMSALPGGGC